MTNRMSADESKRKSRGWSDEMDSESISRRLAIVDELYSCWQSLKNAKKFSPARPEKAISTEMETTNSLHSDLETKQSIAIGSDI